jgi:isocitrate dehydrogenase kinase/phosphatase
LVSEPSIHKGLGKRIQQVIWADFDRFCEAFAAITRRAWTRFEQRDWSGMHRDTVERLDLYPKSVDATTAALIRALGPSVHRHELWSEVKTQFSRACQQRCDAEIAGTYYNSVHRKLFAVTGVEAGLTFLVPPVVHVPKADTVCLFDTDRRSLPQTVRTILQHFGFQTPFANLEEDARLCAFRIGELAAGRGTPGQPLHLEMLGSPFFRDMSAYLVGRICWPKHQLPLVFSLDNGDKGLCVDAVLTTEEQLRVLFSFSRAYFHVQTQCPGAIVAWLKTLMPAKRSAEIYIGLGYHKHGKTELYQDLVKHQQVCSQDRFDFSPGKHGMVMIAFNMPNDDLIYKLIRDRFDRPKHTTARRVMEKYDYIFKHDRAGRLLDVQTFENLELEACCFTPELLDEIKTEASQAATVENGRVVLHHAYVERRVMPLDLYLKQTDADAAKAAVIDYGRAIKDLAQINVFPGDMLLKNFGVTRLGRVVFYDYDEVCPLLACNFRKMPQSPRYEVALDPEPWFVVDDRDVFPEEFTAFLGLPPALRQVFLKYHGDLLEPGFWVRTQEQIRAGTWHHLRPYGQRQRLRRG